MPEYPLSVVWTTVACFRSALSDTAGATSTAEPHLPQNRFETGTSDPHRGQLAPFDFTSPCFN